MTKALSDELEGNTLQVYSFVIKESRPVGPSGGYAGCESEQSQCSLSATAKTGKSGVNRKK